MSERLSSAWARGSQRGGGQWTAAADAAPAIPGGGQRGGRRGGRGGWGSGRSRPGPGGCLTPPQAPESWSSTPRPSSGACIPAGRALADRREIGCGAPCFYGVLAAGSAAVDPSLADASGHFSTTRDDPLGGHPAVVLPLALSTTVRFPRATSHKRSPSPAAAPLERCSWNLGEGRARSWLLALLSSAQLRRARGHQSRMGSGQWLRTLKR